MSARAAKAKPIQKYASIALLRSTLTTASRLLWRPRLEGKEFFPRRGPCFVYGNHSNRWDPFIINCFTQWAAPTAGVMTREYFRHPFLRSVFGGIGILPASKRLAEPFLVRRVLELLQDERIVVIFPEGGSRWDGAPMPWMDATVKLFVRAGVPIHPLQIHGSYRSWPRWADHQRATRVVVEALAPVSFDRKTSLAEAKATLRSFTDFSEDPEPERLWPASLAAPDEPSGRAYRPADGIQRLLYRDPWEDSGAMTTTDGYTVQTRGGRSFRMRADSALVDESDGTIHRSSELYARIKAMPLTKDAVGGYLADEVEVHVERSFPELVREGPANARLFDDRIEVAGQSRRIVPLETITYCDIERNFKLQLYLDGSELAMLQLSFNEAGSALQWKDALDSLRPETAKIDPDTQ